MQSVLSITVKNPCLAIFHINILNTRIVKWIQHPFKILFKSKTNNKSNNIKFIEYLENKIQITIIRVGTYTIFE